jgi:hypothetical protein
VSATDEVSLCNGYSQPNKVCATPKSFIAIIRCARFNITVFGANHWHSCELYSGSVCDKYIYIYSL